MTDPRSILESSRAILLVDWPNTRVPRSLLQAGFKVFGWSPNRYSQAEIMTHPSKEAGSVKVFAPNSEQEKGYLVFRPLEGCPPAVDIISVYRPADELPGILQNHVSPLGAKVVWLLRPVQSQRERELIAERGLVLVEESDIAKVAGSLVESRRAT